MEDVLLLLLLVELEMAPPLRASGLRLRPGVTGCGKGKLVILLPVAVDARCVVVGGGCGFDCSALAGLLFDFDQGPRASGSDGRLCTTDRRCGATSSAMYREDETREEEVDDETEARRCGSVVAPACRARI